MTKEKVAKIAKKKSGPLNGTDCEKDHISNLKIMHFFHF